MGRGGSRTAATSKMERFVIIVKKRSILDVAAVLDSPLMGFIRCGPSILRPYGAVVQRVHLQ